MQSNANSLRCSSYILVILDDCLRFTWVSFLKEKNEAFYEFLKLFKQLQIYKNSPIISIQSDHGREFDKNEFSKLCNEFGISYNFLSTRTPQQNGVVERKKHTLEDMARTIFCESSLTISFWTEALNTINYVLNRCLIRLILKKTPYELFKGRKSSIAYFRTFSCKCFIHNNRK